MRKNFFKITLIILCLGAVTLFALIEAGAELPFLEAYKKNFKQNVSGISNVLGIDLPIEMQLYLDDMTPPEPKPTMMPAAEQEALEAALGMGEQEETPPAEGTAELSTRAPIKTETYEDPQTAFSGAQNARFAEVGGKIIAVNETRYRAFNKKGELLWEIPIQVQSPQLTVRGSYVLINETGAKKLLLYKEDKKIFEAAADGNIVTADLSEKGDVVAVAEKEFFKGQVVVFNKKGKIIFAWDSGSYNILDAAISKDRNVAVSMLNTDSGADSYIACFNVNGEEKYRTEDFKNSVIFDIEFCGSRLNAIADSCAAGISGSGKTLWEYGYEGRTLNDYAIAKNGSKMLLFDESGTGEIVVISAGGKVYDPIRTETMPVVLGIKSDYIAYNSGRDAITSDFKGNKILRASSSSDIKQMCLIDKNEVLLVHSDSIRVKKLEKQKKKEAIVIEAPEKE